MADQGRWFKLWTTAPDDPDLGSLPLEDFARWCLFGVYLKVHGEDGEITIKDPCLPLQNTFRVSSFHSVISTLQLFPNCSVTEVTNTTVTYKIKWCNWVKYQGDFSGDRVKRWREKNTKRVTPKKRGEEKRGEEKRGEEKREEGTTLGAVVGEADTPAPPDAPVWPEALRDVEARLRSLGAPDVLASDPGYWQRIDEWVEGTGLPVYYLEELKAYLAWLAAQPKRKQHRDLRAGFRNWLATAIRWKERDAQRTEQRKHYGQPG